MFMKENKYFTQTNFWLPVIYILVLGIFFTEDSTYTKVMHYDQDNETKGKEKTHSLVIQPIVIIRPLLNE